MQFVNRIKGARSFSELQKVIVEARSSNELKNSVLYEAIRKLDSKECKNVKMGYELAKQIPLEALQSLDKYTVHRMLNCSSQLAHKSFKLLKNPNSYSFYYYVNSFKKAKANELSPEMIEELGSLWRKVELSGGIDNIKLLNQLFSVLSFSKEKQRNLLTYIISKPPNSSFNCGLIGNFLKFCSKINDLDLAKTVWNWGEPIRDRENGTFSFFLISYQYYGLLPPPISELTNLWSQIMNARLEGRVELVSSMCKSLSHNLEEQRKFIIHVISKDPDPSFTCGLMGGFLKHCSEANDAKNIFRNGQSITENGNLLKYISEVNDLDFAKTVWNWSQPIRDRECDTFEYFWISYQYYSLFPPSIADLKYLWSRVKSSGLDGKLELVTSMCKALCHNLEEQRKFITYIISKEPDPSFTCGLLGGFIKHCTETKDVNFARDIWRWGQPIRDNNLGCYNVLVTFQYLTLCESVSEQRAFIMKQISRPIPSTYHCGIIGAFLSHCSDQNNLELASKIWSWSLDFRSQCKGSSDLRQISIQYISICAGSGELSLLEEVWKEANDFKVGNFIEAIGAFVNVLATNGAVDRALEVFNKVPSKIMNESILTSTLNALSHTGRDFDALNILRRFQREKPEILSVISYTSVIDAFARNGNFEMALSVIDEMKRFGIEPDIITWMSILSPCRFHKNLPVALKAFEELQKVEHKPEDITPAYVLLADVYKSCGDLITFHKLHLERKNKGLFKVRGGVQLCLPNSQTLSFYVNEIPSSLEPDVRDQIGEILDTWIPILEKIAA